VPARAPTHHSGAAPQPPRTPAAINAISSNPRQNTPCLSARARLNGRQQAATRSHAWLFDRRPNRHAQNTDDIFHASRQHCGADAARQRAISRSCIARTDGRASRISATANYRIATGSHVSEVWRDSRKYEISFWTVPVASARSRLVIAFHGVDHLSERHRHFRPASAISARFRHRQTARCR
jgi:hypothetical protein